MAGIALAEADKYDVLEKIGKQSRTRPLPRPEN
jgi:hypothetical protein